MKTFEHISARFLLPSSDGDSETADTQWGPPESVVAAFHSRGQERWIEFRRHVSTADESTSANDDAAGDVIGTANLIEGSQVRDPILILHVQNAGFRFQNHFFPAYPEHRGVRIGNVST